MNTLAALLLACSDEPVETDSDGPVYDPYPPTTLGGARPAAVVLPAGYDVAQRWPVVVLLHGYGVNSTIQEAIFALGQRTDALGFILIKPEGTTDSMGNQFWNATPECCDLGNVGVDDVAYLGGLIDEAQSLYPIDQVALVGHSNGGFMSYRLACEIPEKLDRIAVLAGAVYKDERDCVGTTPVSVLHMHGTFDSTILYDSNATHAGAEESAGRWVTKGGCTGSPVVEARNYLSNVPGDETVVTKYTGCADGVDVQLWGSAGGDHSFIANNTAFKDDVATWLVE
jgi:polyhydroxybutyrate depolymerase